MKRISMKALISIVILATVAASAQVVDVAPRQLAPRTFANLGTPGNGTVLYCSDCQKTSPCTGSGSGAMAKRENGAWNCGGTGSGNVTAAGTLTSGLPVIGGGSTAVAVGTRTGNTTEYVTQSGSKTAGKQVTYDADGNAVASAYDVGAAGGGASVTTAHTGMLCSLDSCYSAGYYSYANSNAYNGKVFLVAIFPKVNYTIRRANVIADPVVSNASTGFAIGIYSAAGSRLGYGVNSTAVNYSAAEVAFGSDVSLTAGTLYYAAFSAEDAEATTLGYNTGLREFMAINKTGSRIFIGECAESATGTGSGYTLPSSCTVQALTDPAEALKLATVRLFP